MKHIFVAILFMTAAIVSSDGMALDRNPEVNAVSQSKTKSANFLIYKIDFREDLTRVYMKIIGRPHTSFRIDSLQLSTVAGEKYDFTDIDGIDAKRYFQWEDNGQIDVEVDFPAMKEQDIIYLTIFSPDGVFKTSGGNPEF